MHEMALAEGILDIALDEAKKNQAQRIAKITLRLGEMSGVETDSLEFCFESLVKDTIAAGAELVLHHIPLRGRCQKCGYEMHIEHYRFICPRCGVGVLELISGRELQVESIDME
jgi:hydrogenase nickel incorporation protein HypA/HybF